MMNNELLISVIVPVYNVEQYLEECLESIIAADIIEAEFILIDDGSTDGSNQILKEYQLKDPRIKLIEQDNAGNGAARNAGLEIASGEYILFLDSDDILFPESITKALDNATANCSDIIICDYFEFEDLSKPKYRYDRANLPEGVTSDHEMIMNKILYLDISFSVWNKIYNRSFLSDNSLSFKAGVWFEDLEFIFRAFYHARVVSKENSVLVGYRQREGSIMKSVSKKVLDKKTIVYESQAFLESHDEMNVFTNGFKFMFFKMYISIIYQVLKNKGTLSKKRDILEHVFNDPYFFNEILNNSLVYRQIGLSEKLLYLQIKWRILGLRTLSIYNALLKLERI
jgi:glycosyltransferase involved in cell wall biosynthesis